MKSSHKGGMAFSGEEEDSPLYFGEWIKRRRMELDLTQAQLAKNACCTVFTIRKIEIGERRPSRQLAGLLAQSLEIPCEDQSTFIKAARGEISMERWTSPARAPFRDSKPSVKPNTSTIPINLPRSLTPFIGREPELTALGQLLCDPQCLLLTIVGPGGIGKTRLAIEAANQNKDHFPDGVWFVPFAPLNSPTLIVPTIADTVDFKFSDPTNHQAQLLRYLHQKRALVVLDNAEHLLDGVVEGQTEKALEITLVLKDCPVEYKIAQDEGNCLLADLQAVLPKEIVEAVTKQVDEKITPDQTGAAALAYALELITG